MLTNINKTVIANSTPSDKPYEIRDNQMKGLLLRVQPSGVKTYYVEIKRGTRIKIGRPEVLSPVQARDAAKEILLNGNKYINSSKGIVFRDFLNKYYSPWAINHQKTNGNIVMLFSIYSEFLTLELDEITLMRFEQHTANRIMKGIAKSTINRNLNILKAALNKAVEWNLIDINPLRHAKRFLIPESDQKRYLTVEEENRIKEALNHPSVPEYMKPMVLLAINTGIRHTELLTLTWDRVHLDKEKPYVSIIGAYSKSSKTRYVPLNTEALSAFSHHYVQAYRFQGGNVWGKKFFKIDKQWKYITRLAGIKNCRFHDLRHHAASKWVMAGMDLYLVAQILGHSTIKITMQYAHLSPEYKSHEMTKLNYKENV